MLIFRTFLVIFFLNMVMPLLTQAEIQVPTGYKAEIFVSGLSVPANVEFNDKGELFVIEAAKDRILNITPNGTISVFAKSAPEAPLDFAYAYWVSHPYPYPTKMDFDKDGNLWVGVTGWYDDPYNPYGDVLDTVYKITPDGVVVPIARQWFGSNMFFDIAGLTFDASGYLYIGDTWYPHDILKVDTTTMSATVFATGVYSPIDLLFDKEGNLLVCAWDWATQKYSIFRFAPDGTRTLYNDTIPNPQAIAWGPEGYLYVADYTTKTIYRLDPATSVATAFAAGFDYPIDLGFDSKGNLYVVDTTIGQIIKISKAELPVEIDIKPGSFPNAIKLQDTGNIPVAIFSTSTFDAANIDVATLELNGAGVRIVNGKGLQYSFDDVNGDGLMDLVVHFDRGTLELTVGDTSATVTGTTQDGRQIQGTDSVVVIE
ncbi:MAG TPA: hypothetical protein DD725_06885 [Deltaproteobacteria bacterium]|nr:MAG: hypothetical protein A3A85_00620 [Deltaproteobacteria bacterium RIFCSPLOWO2_01_FULL_42_9]HBR17316.1 hypothetical protein [Deltaproteobacteria bacterium]